MRNARLDELQAGIKVERRNINNLRYADDTTIMAESQKELMNLLMRVNKESERASFELWCWRRLLKVLWTARRSN